MGSWFEQSFVFYLSYHNDKTNQLIHILCVWPILFTAQIFLSYTPSLMGMDPDGVLALATTGHGCNMALLISLFYAVYYCVIEQPGFAGPLAAAMVVAGYYASANLTSSFPSCWMLALAVHVICWAAQIFGHQVYEKRSPALLDNLVQAFLMAPLFVLLEVLFSFGYKSDFSKQALTKAEVNIAKFRESKKQQ